jgi:hypothetical protein
MAWLNNFIVDFKQKFVPNKSFNNSHQSLWIKSNHQESDERISQFQSRLQDLDRRILDLR